MTSFASSLRRLSWDELALVDDDAVADQADMGAALDHTVGDAATGDLADLRHVEDLQDLGLAETLLAQGRRQHARQGRFDVIHEVVDDVVVADLDAVALGRLARFLVGTHVEADDDGLRGLRQGDVRLGDAADAREQDARRDLVVAELLQRAVDGLDRALHVALDDERQFLAAGALLEVAHHVDERAVGTAGAGGERARASGGHGTR